MNFKLVPAMAGFAALSLFTVLGPAVTPASARVHCGQAPSCRGLHGRRWDLCQAKRADAEADCQARGVGRESGRHRVRGRGPKYRKCKNFARELRNGGAELDEATSMRDCQ